MVILGCRADASWTEDELVESGSKKKVVWITCGVLDGRLKGRDQCGDFFRFDGGTIDVTEKRTLPFPAQNLHWCALWGPNHS